MLKERLQRVEERIHAAANRAGRRPSDITLIAVTKKFPAETVCEAYGLGLRVFGENYVQEFETKRPALGALADAQFHLIGHLQSNKARIATEIFHTIETVDSEKLARRLDGMLASLENAPPDKLEVMIEVKLSGEESKAGAAPEELPKLIEAVHACPNLSLTGLMTMPPWNDDQEVTRPYFRRLAALARKHGIPRLSMGMSHDLEAAIEEGATHIRVGTALFGPRPKPA
jgi:pyridoxal phosphate enzyme (YggS family)